MADIQPWPFDILTRVIKVVRSNTVFILSSSGLENDNAILRITGTTVETITLPDTSEWGPITSVRGFSYHRMADDTPVFLLCGLFDFEIDEFFDAWFSRATGSVIFASNDGTTWYQVFMSKTEPETDENDDWSGVVSIANALVWNNGAFYYDQRKIISTGQPIDQIYKSTNGNSWSLVSEEEVAYTAETGGWRSSYPPSYCTHNNSIDSLGQNVPDGYMHKEPSGMLMRPKEPPTISYGLPNWEAGTSPLVEIIRPDIPMVAVNPGVGNIACAAGASGNWMVGGRGGLARAGFLPDGDVTWTKILGMGLGPDDFVTYMVAGNI